MGLSGSTLRESSGISPMPSSTASIIAEKAARILIQGQDVTFEKGPMGWVATGWQQGLPVARKPVSDALVVSTLQRFPEDAISMTF